MPRARKVAIRELAADFETTEDHIRAAIHQLGEYVERSSKTVDPSIATLLREALGDPGFVVNAESLAHVRAAPQKYHQPAPLVAEEGAVFDAQRVVESGRVWLYRGGDGTYEAKQPREPDDQVIGHRDTTVTTESRTVGRGGHWVTETQTTREQHPEVYY
ncbi:hypothetical protein [Microbacterium lushaniae]|uniref:Uncharacterized protein n=1 Tax=Microbacterium lushaniae TaxID=2614639 RepID=A0A5J6L898_9MICO|nr:hypothetical protein [Microbacterium lushaniae]QEW04641.1 hypothetical protein F6J85_17150 [Microbacterium lushaniae]